MNSIPGRETENWTLSFNQPKETHKKGLLLGTDFRHAVEFSRSGRTRTTAFRPSFEAVSHCTPRSTAVGPRGPVRRFPRLAARSVLARCRENGTPPAGPSARGSAEGTPRRSAPAGRGAVLWGHQVQRHP